MASVSNPAIKIALSNIISESVKFLQEEIVALRTINQTQANDMTQLKRELASTRDDLEALKNCYDLARQELADLQQYTRRNALRIFNPAWKEQKDEDTDQLILTLANKLNVDLQAWEISRSHRVGVPQEGKVRPVLVKFIGYQSRQKLFKARRLLKDKPALKNVYINEDLTKATNELAYKARQCRRAGKILETFTSDGKVFVKRFLGGKIIHVKNEDELKKVAAMSQHGGILTGRNQSKRPGPPAVAAPDQGSNSWSRPTTGPVYTVGLDNQVRD